MSNLNTCVVCGQVSSRASWNNTINSTSGSGFTTTFVACDFHSQNLILTTIMAQGFNPTTGYQKYNDPGTIQESTAS